VSQPELLKRVVEVLDEAGVEYLVTGSMASSLQGAPRATHDIDLVVALPEDAIPELVQAFPAPGYYLSEEAIRDAVRRRGVFNLVSLDSGDKVDFWLLRDTPFDRSRFSRKYDEEFAGVRVKVSRPEDTILAKLRWAKQAGGSEKQFMDALHVYEVQFVKLDREYLDRWAGELGLRELLDRLRDEAEPVE
jgi:hypothetical protein